MTQRAAACEFAWVAARSGGGRDGAAHLDAIEGGKHNEGVVHELIERHLFHDGELACAIAQPLTKRLGDECGSRWKQNA